jgi:hypothetical protein
VVEVRYDHFTGHRFRHGTTLLRWRPDKSPHLARRREYKLPDGIRCCLMQVVEGYNGRCDEAAARRAIEWMREKFPSCASVR